LEEDEIADSQQEHNLSMVSSICISQCSEDADEKNLSRLNDSLANDSLPLRENKGMLKFQRTKLIYKAEMIQHLGALRI
jgi:hypothetical protein